MDIGVIIDRSGSIGSANFKKAQDFVVKMIRHFEYASSESRFGIIAYNSYASVSTTFKNKGNQNINSLKNIVYGKQINYPSSTSNGNIVRKFVSVSCILWV